MKLLSSILALLVLSAPAVAHGQAQQAPAPPAPPAVSQAERTVAAARDVLVELSLESGDVVVRGWDRDEVRARSDEAPRIELRKYASPAPGEAKDMSGAAKDAPARRVEVFVLHSKDDPVRPGESSGSGNVELNVPRGATVFLKVQSGDIEVSNVAEARIESASGDIDLTGISKGVDIDAFSGDISVADSRGSIRLRSLSGSVEATNLKPNDEKDEFTVKSMSGDILLENVTHAKIEGETTSGNVRFDGALATGGGYKLQTTSGDLTMSLPAAASFRVNARIILSGEIITDFVVKTAAPKDKPGPLNRLDGVVGTGDADINLSAFSGTVHLRKN
ncbi:MAG TPA: DUF4097 family beta strand repeat-containing protein [Pyrinomonadaceae bacterium]